MAAACPDEDPAVQMMLLSVQMRTWMSRWDRLDVQMTGTGSRCAHEEGRFLSPDVQMAAWVSR